MQTLYCSERTHFLIQEAGFILHPSLPTLHPTTPSTPPPAPPPSPLPLPPPPPHHHHPLHPLHPLHPITPTTPSIPSTPPLHHPCTSNVICRRAKTSNSHMSQKSPPWLPGYSVPVRCPTTYCLVCVLHCLPRPAK